MRPLSRHAGAALPGALPPAAAPPGTHLPCPPNLKPEHWAAIQGILQQHGRLIGGVFSLEVYCGRGSQGFVAAGRNTQTGERTAGKISWLPKEFGNCGPSRAKEEAEVHELLKHHCIAKYYGFYQVDGRDCVMLQHCDSGNLVEFMEAKPNLTPKERLRLSTDLLSGAAHMHDNNVLHLDLKPPNLMVNNEHTKPRMKIIDFGMAVVLPLGQDKVPGHPRGTVAYMAPEVAMGKHYSRKSDMWSIAQVLFFIWTWHYKFSMWNGHPPQEALELALQERLERGTGVPLSCRHMPLRVRFLIANLGQLDEDKRMSCKEAIAFINSTVPLTGKDDAWLLKVEAALDEQDRKRAAEAQRPVLGPVTNTVKQRSASVSGARAAADAAPPAARSFAAAVQGGAAAEKDSSCAEGAARAAAAAQPQQQAPRRTRGANPAASVASLAVVQGRPASAVVPSAVVRGRRR